MSRTYSDKMQLVANKVQYKRDVYDDLKFQMDVFSECFEKGVYMAILVEGRGEEGRGGEGRREERRGRYTTKIMISLCTGKQTKDSTSAFFGCYSDSRLAHRVIRSHPFVMDSIYVYQLRNWLQSFPRHQLLFIKGEGIHSIEEVSFPPPPPPFFLIFIFLSSFYILISFLWIN